jgi:hypothetical protein
MALEAWEVEHGPLAMEDFKHLRGYPMDESNTAVAFEAWLLMESLFYATHERVDE